MTPEDETGLKVFTLLVIITFICFFAVICTFFLRVMKIIGTFLLGKLKSKLHESREYYENHRSNEKDKRPTAKSRRSARQSI